MDDLLSSPLIPFLKYQGLIPDDPITRGSWMNACDIAIFAAGTPCTIGVGVAIGDPLGGLAGAAVGFGFSQLASKMCHK